MKQELIDIGIDPDLTQQDGERIVDPDLRLFTEERQIDCINLAKRLLPEDAKLLLLSYTGSRAFGWGTDKHDYDIHGLFVYPNWFNKCHSDIDTFDMTIKNIKDLDHPNFRRKPWKQFYDKGKPFYINDEWDYWGDFMSILTKEHVINTYPFDVKMQIGRMENEFNARNVLHTYKELLIPLHYLQHEKIESNVVHKVNPHPDYQYEGIKQAAEWYGGNYDTELDEELIWSEINELDNQLEFELINQTSYDPTENPEDPKS